MWKLKNMIVKRCKNWPNDNSWEFKIISYPLYISTISFFCFTFVILKFKRFGKVYYTTRVPTKKSQVSIIVIQTQVPSYSRLYFNLPYSYRLLSKSFFFLFYPFFGWNNNQTFQVLYKFFYGKNIFSIENIYHRARKVFFFFLNLKLINY